MPKQFNKRYYMFDMARMRSVCKPEIICLLDVLERCGYNGLGLYIEGAFSYNGDGVVRKGVPDEKYVEFLREECSKRGMILFPMINVLYHMEHILCQERYAYLRRAGQFGRYTIDFENPAAKPFAMEIISHMVDLFKTTYIHIGCDEAQISKEEHPACAAYIADLCQTMIDKGWTPGVWGDMFLDDEVFLKAVPKETAIYDWNYYGHRPESLIRLRDEGFKEVFAVPSDNGWEGFVNCQRAGSFMQARGDWAVGNGEVEAFLSDSAEAGLANGMLAHWEDSAGRSVWSTLSPLARAGLYMNGKWNPDVAESVQTEKILFGRETPYSAIIEALRPLHLLADKKCHIRLPQDAIYREESMPSMLIKPAGFWNEFIKAYDEALPSAWEMLNKWTPEGETEKYARDSLESILTNMQASSTLMKAAEGKVLYRQAAEIQFTDKERFVSLLEEIRGLFAAAENCIERSMTVRMKSIQYTGITRQDIDWQKKLIAYLRQLRDKLTQWTLDAYTEGAEKEALQAWKEFIFFWEFGIGGVEPV